MTPGVVALVVAAAGAIMTADAGEQAPATAGGASFELGVRPDGSLERFSRSIAARRPVIAVTRGRPDDGQGVGERIDPTAVGHRFLTEDLNLWSGPGESYDLRSVLGIGRRVAITGVAVDAWTQVLVSGAPGWVNSAYLARTKPEPPPAEPAPTATDRSGSDRTSDRDSGSSEESRSPSALAGISDAPCATGSAVENGLTPDAILVHRGVCAAFPAVTTYGGVRPDGEHGEGRALDIMVTGSAGDAVAAWVQDDHAELGVSEILWAQQIWTVQRSSEGWRPFEDRGSVTANHFDHVHVTVYGNSGN